MRVRWVAASAAAVLCACAAHTPPQIGDRGPMLADPGQEKQYQERVDRFSRNAEIYNQLRTRVFAAATYQSWQFRQARVEREGTFKALPRAEVDAQLAEERTQFEQSHEFFFGAFVNDYRQENFSNDKVWHVALLTGRGEVRPSKIERIGRSDLNMRAYYPYLGEFWVAWRIRFPKKMEDGTPVLAEGDQKVTLRVASTVGKVELTYTVE
jgi:hypothetical protein